MEQNDRTLSILMLDDHELVLEGLRRVLDEMPEVKSVATASSPQQLLRKSRENPCDLYIIDIELADGNGLDVMRDLRRLQPEARFIVCTMHEEVWTLHALLKQRPEGIVLKLSGVKAVKEAVAAVAGGGEYRCPRFKQLYGHLERAGASRVKQNLPTPREKEVLEGIAQGLSTTEIADRLCLTENTVEGYRKSLMLKLEARNVADLVVKALGKGFIELTSSFPHTPGTAPSGRS